MTNDEVRAAARRHAQRASEILGSVEERDRALAERREDEDRYLQDVATGMLTRFNRQQEFSIELARAHALTAQALVAAADHTPQPR